MVFDPATARAILEASLTLAGGTVTAGIIAAVIEVAKRMGGFGAWLDAGREYAATLVLSAAFLLYAAWATAYPIDPISIFALFLAWLGLSAIAGKAYDAARAGVSKA